jgi:hypothetical protein
MQLACMVTVTTSRPRFNHRVSPEYLGLDPDQVPEEMRLGRISLLKDMEGAEKRLQERLKVFDLFFSRARELVRSYSMPFLKGKTNISIVPNTAIIKLLEGEPEDGMDENGFLKKPGLPHLSEYVDQEAKLFIADYAEMIETSLKAWRHWAENTYRRDSHGQVMRDENGNKIRVVKNVDNFMSRLAHAFPSVTSLEFSLERYFTSIRVPEISAEHIENENQLKAIQKARAEAQETLTKEIKASFGQFFIAMRKELSDIITTMLEGKVHQHTFNRFRKFVERYKQMTSGYETTETMNFEKDLEALEKDFLSKPAKEYREDEGDLSALKTALLKFKGDNDEYLAKDDAEVAAAFGNIGKRKIAV